MLIPLFLLSLFTSNVLSDSECPNVPGLPGDRRKDKSKMRIVQYNVEWLFIDYNSEANCPGYGCTWVNKSEAEIHMDYVANVIKLMI